MSIPQDCSDLTKEHDELLLELRRVDAEYKSSHEQWIHEHVRLSSEKDGHDDTRSGRNRSP